MYVLKSTEEDLALYANGKTVNVFDVKFSNHEDIIISHMLDCKRAIETEDYIVVASILYIDYACYDFSKEYTGNKEDLCFHEINRLIESVSHTDIKKEDMMDETMEAIKNNFQT